MNREYHVWHSSCLDRRMELLVFGHAGERLLAFPTRDGRFFDYENWRIVDAVRDKIDAGQLQLYCVDSYDRWSLYADWMRPEDRMQRHLAYEAYILSEVVPFSTNRNPDSALSVLGCSLGAYHAVNLALKHPARFTRVLAFSGRYDLTQSTPFFRDLFDGNYDDLIYFNTPEHFLPGLDDPALLEELRRLHITLAVGETDAFLPSNDLMARLLSEKQIPHALHVWHGEAHRARDWRQMLRLYL